jgi:hypothetical protein
VAAAFAQPEAHQLELAGNQDFKADLDIKGGLDSYRRRRAFEVIAHRSCSANATTPVILPLKRWTRSGRRVVVAGRMGAVS